MTTTAQFACLISRPWKVESKIQAVFENHQNKSHLNFRAKNDTSFVGTEYHFTILQNETFLSYFSNSNTAIRYWKWHFANSASLSIFFSRVFSLPNRCIFPLHFYLENFRWRVSVYLRYLTKMIKRSFTSSGQSWWVYLLLIVSSHVLKAVKKLSLATIKKSLVMKMHSLWTIKLIKSSCD